MTSVLNILAEDAKHRYLGVRDDLYTLHDLSNDSSWNYDLPTLIKDHDYSRNKILKNNNDFKKAFYKKLPFLTNVNLDNMLIAGGSIRSILLNKYINDVDIFLYGIDNIKDGQRRIERFIIDIYENVFKIKDGTHITCELANHNKLVESALSADKKYKLAQEFLEKYSDRYKPNIDTNITVYSNGNTITLFVDGIKIQIILRLYNTISEILHGFDLGSSSVGFNGSNVYFTTLSKFSFENMVNIVDHTRRSTTYENRLIKYFDSGFNIVLPNLDMDKLKTDYHKYDLAEVCVLPYMIFSYSSINGNSIIHNKFHTQSGNDVITDYDFYGNLNSVDGKSKYMLLKYNITELIKGKNRFIVKIDLNEEISILRSKGQDPISWTLNFNKQLIDVAFIEWNYNKLTKILDDDKIYTDKIKKYINVIDFKQFINDVYLSDLSKGAKTAKIYDIISKQKNKIKQDLANLETKFDLNWIIENPTTQLTSSVNPIVENASNWYGEYFLNNDELLLRLDKYRSNAKKIEKKSSSHREDDDENDENNDEEDNDEEDNEEDEKDW